MQDNKALHPALSVPSSLSQRVDELSCWPVALVKLPRRRTRLRGIVEIGCTSNIGQEHSIYTASMKRVLLGFVLFLALLVIVIPLYIKASINPQEQIMGKWYRLSNDASVVTFFPQGKLVVHYERSESDLVIKYDLSENGYLYVNPGASMLSANEKHTIRFASKNVMFITSAQDGTVKYCRNQKDLANPPKGHLAKFQSFWRVLTWQDI